MNQFGIHDLEKVGVDFCLSLHSLLLTNEFSGQVPKNYNHSSVQVPIEEKKIPRDSDEEAQKESSESSDDDG